MPLVVWSPDLAWLAKLAKHDACTTIMWSYDAGIDVDKGLPYLSLWNQCEKSDLWLYIVSPTYAPFVPFVVLVVDLSYSREDMRANGAKSLWYSSSRRGELSLYNLVGFLSIDTYTGLFHNGHLSIEESEYPRRRMATLRLLPQLLL